MKNLKEAGVPFGISVTATKNNAEIAVSDELMNYYFNECGAVYGWIFQIMPIGRAKGLDLMVSPEQRLAMYRRTQHLIKDRKLFIADFLVTARLLPTVVFRRANRADIFTLNGTAMLRLACSIRIRRSISTMFIKKAAISTMFSAIRFLNPSENGRKNTPSTESPRKWAICWRHAPSRTIIA